MNLFVIISALDLVILKNGWEIFKCYMVYISHKNIADIITNMCNFQVDSSNYHVDDTIIITDSTNVKTTTLIIHKSSKCDDNIYNHHVKEIFNSIDKLNSDIKVILSDINYDDEIMYNFILKNQLKHVKIRLTNIQSIKNLIVNIEKLDVMLYNVNDRIKFLNDLTELLSGNFNLIEFVVMQNHKYNSNDFKYDSLYNLLYNILDVTCIRNIKYCDDYSFSISLTENDLPMNKRHVPVIGKSKSASKRILNT